MLLVFRPCCAVVVFDHGVLMRRVLALPLMHGARTSLGPAHRAVGCRRRFMALRVGWAVRGTAVSRNERGQPRDLEHEPGHGDDAQFPPEDRHDSDSA
jgi:hypothetical protein